MQTVLAGPILRRADAGRVCVWLATSRPCEVRAEVFALDDLKGPDPSTLGSGTAHTVRLGQALFVHLVQVRPGDESFPTDELLAYDVVVEDEVGKEQRLADLGLLDGPDAIVYEGMPLPTFFLRKDTPHLNLMHGSCHLLHGMGEDAFLAADETLSSSADEVERRPSLMILTGDQIYGDEVGGPLIRHLTQLGQEVIGPHDQTSVPDMPPLNEVDVYGRQELMTERAKFTSGNAENHLVSFGEFAAMYLISWESSHWPDRLPDVEESLEGLEGAERSKLERLYNTEYAGLERARAAVPAIRRVLANAPIYTVFDDHDVTDDWNLTRRWCEQVRSSPAGRRVITNALASFWAFQGWGNNPDAFDGSFLRRLADLLGQENPGDGLDDLMWNIDYWSYTLPTRPVTVALDTRTQRSFDSDEGAARLISESELDRVRKLVRDSGHRRSEPLVLVSPVPVFGLELQERRQKFLVGKVGPYEIDFEAWHSNLQGFVDFMCFLVDELELKFCVLLSGDVHYGMNVEASFQHNDRKLHFAQLVSSSFKHSGKLSKSGIELLGQLVSKKHERVGWDKPPTVASATGLREKVLERQTNTDEWNGDAPVFLGPKRMTVLRIEQDPEYRERRSYVRPEEPRSSYLTGENNIGVVSIREHEVVHCLLSSREGEPRPRTATITIEPRTETSLTP
jgi:hypothetical protein